MSSNVTAECNSTLTEEVRVFLKVAYIPVFILGLPLNALALYAFLLRRARWTDTHVYMINLVLADLTLVLFLPFKIYDVFRRLEASAFCTALISTHYLNVYVSVLTVTGISVHRFAAVRFPFRARARGSSKRTAFVVCVLAWATVATLCTVFRDSFRPDRMHSCSERKPEPLPRPFLLVLFLAGFLLPFCTIVLCSGQTIAALLSGEEDEEEESGRQLKRKSVAVVTANMIVFIVCYTPFHVVLLVKNLVKLDCAQYNFLHNIVFVTEWVATTNCCLDSIGYYFLFKNVLR